MLISLVRSSGEIFLMLVPLILISPPYVTSSSKPAIIVINVDLPQPDGPVKSEISPPGKVTSTFSKIGFSFF